MSFVYFWGVFELLRLVSFIVLGFRGGELVIWRGYVLSGLTF